MRAEPLQRRPSRRRRADRRARPRRHRLCAVLSARRLLAAAVVDTVRRGGATPMQVALAWLLRRAPNVLLIPGTSSLAHLHENLAASGLVLPDDALADFDRIAGAGTA
ncbi:aldo/keto reductase [Burkholderia cepacia]|uniref:aldo/keto reductase n=1 Tax=Burkholderia cepacia TaxID=292 RepID=UPI00158A667C|nr:aldo/keto reductase [Burkholderia cepacia]